MLTFGRFGREDGVEVECLVRDDGRLEGRDDLLLEELVEVDGREEGVLLQVLDSVRTWEERLQL